MYEKPRELLDCSPFSWGVVPPDVSDGGCNAEAYNGGVCRQHLLEWQECVLGKLDVSFVTPVDKNSSRLDSAVRDLQLLLGNLNLAISLPSEEISMQCRQTIRRTTKRRIKSSSDFLSSL